jgi:hypothetical protein
MSNQTNPRESNDFFELQINLEHAFAQLEADDDTSLVKYLEIIIYIAQNHSIENIATKINKNYDDTINYIIYSKQKLMQYPPIKQCQILTNDEQDWIDLLAGKSVPNADSEIVRDTEIFRAALLSYSDKPTDPDEIPYPHILEQVLDRLEAEKYT